MNTARLSSVVALSLLALASLGCAGPEDLTGQPPSGDDPADGADDGAAPEGGDAEPGAEPGDGEAGDEPAEGDGEVAGGDAPPGPWESAPGWVAVAARGADATRSFTPIVEGAAAVVFDAEAWATVPAGTTLSVLTADATKHTVTFRGMETVPYGCEGHTQTVAVFDGEALPEGAWWLTADGAAAVFDFEIDGAAEPALVNVKAGPATGFVKRWNPFGGGTVISVAGVERYRGEWKVEGADRPEVDLTDPEAVGVQFPEAWVELGEDGLLLLRTHGARDVTFSVVHVGHGGEGGGEAGAPIGQVAVERCAG